MKKKTTKHALTGFHNDTERHRGSALDLLDGRIIAEHIYDDRHVALFAAAPEMAELLRTRPGVRTSGAEYNALRTWQDAVDALLRRIEGES